MLLSWALEKKRIFKTGDMQVKIPMVGNIVSLNVSVATGIILFEANQNRDYNHDYE